MFRMIRLSLIGLSVAQKAFAPSKSESAVVLPPNFTIPPTFSSILNSRPAASAIPSVTESPTATFPTLPVDTTALTIPPALTDASVSSAAPDSTSTNGAAGQAVGAIGLGVLVLNLL
jgi:hypothetical protein